MEIELRRLVKRFGSTVAVADLSLEIRPGEFVSLLGPSGCGKTTTLRMIAGFEAPTEGEIYIGGARVDPLPAYRRPVNTVFQHYALFPHLTVFENVAYGPRRRGVPRGEIAARVREVLRLVSLEHLGGRFPAQLSGGQQQRVALARALVNKPRALLLDEPLGALDVQLRKQMQVELKRLQEQVGIAFLYVTHDQDEALALSDRIGIMSQGRLVQVGAPREIYRAPASRFVAEFIGEHNLVSCRHGQDGAWRLPGDLRVAVPNGAAGSVLAVRPDRVRVSRGPLPLPNSFPAVVRSTVFLGVAVVVHAAVADGLVLAARVADVGLADGLRRGEAIHVGWDPADSRLLPD